MASAANIQEAIDDVVQSGLGAPTQWDDWMVSMYTPAGFAIVAVGSATFWAESNIDQRTVFDWVIPSLVTQRIITALGFTVESQNLVINNLVRTLLAVQAAQIASRITQDQEDTVVAAYNAAF